MTLYRCLKHRWHRAFYTAPIIALVATVVLLLAPSDATAQSPNNPPVFDDGATTTVDANDKVPGGSEFGKFVPATDVDGDTITYSLADDDGTSGDYASFSINSSTARLSTGDGVTLDSSKDYVFKVVADDGSYTASIDVTVDVAACDAAWCGTVTSHAKGGFLGYSTGVQGRLRPSRAVELDGAVYHIEALSQSGTGANLYLGFDEDLVHDSLSGLGLELEIGSNAFALNADSESGGHRYYDWITNQKFLEHNFVVDVKLVDYNAPPAFPSTETGTRSVDENTASGEDIGDPVAATDGEGDTLTYSLGGTDAASFAIDASGQITSSAALDYETKSSYSVEVQVSDGKDKDGNADTAIDAAITVSISAVSYTHLTLPTKR